LMFSRDPYKPFFTSKIIKGLRSLFRRILRSNYFLKYASRSRNFIRAFLKCAIAVLILSAIIDYILWFTMNFHVPCWAIASMSLSTSLILYVMIRLLPET
ncbi:MAG: hypothetical protein QXR62_01935, partial [Candidatus Bathyarchaeia archaeon]